MRKKSEKRRKISRKTVGKKIGKKSEKIGKSRKHVGQCGKIERIRPRDHVESIDLGERILMHLTRAP